MAKRKRLAPATPVAHAPVSGGLETKSHSALGPPIAQVAGDAAQAAALSQVAGALSAARADGRLIIELPLEDIAADHLTRDRLLADDEDMAALRDSLRQHGQRTPIEVVTRTGSPAYGLISGWRRLQALRALRDETGAPAFATVRALIRHPDTAAAAYVAMVEENEIRVGLSYFERARVVAITRDQGVFTSDQEALRSLFANVSRAKRSKIGSFVRLYRMLGDALRFPVSLPERLGLRLTGWLEAMPERPEMVRAALAANPPSDSAAELKALERQMAGPAKPAPDPGAEFRPGVHLDLRRSGQTITLQLRGAGVDDTLLKALRAHLDRLPTG